MLILSRKPKEKIVLGDDGMIAITVLSINGNQVQLGIEAPDDIPIDRVEIFLKKLQKAKDSYLKKQKKDQDHE